MCFATAALIAGVAGTAISAGGQLEQGQATANAANYSAQVAKNNSEIAEQNAAYAVAAGVRGAADSSLKGAAKMGRLKASQAASGIDVNSGSAAEVQQSERELNKLDSETVLNNAELQAYGYRAQATGFRASSDLSKLTAEQAPIGAAIGAAGSTLSSASSLGFRWKTMGSGADAGASFTGVGSSPY
jgi:hypothetical protein